MFDIGFWELLVIAVVLLLVMGPERLPDVAKQAAFFVRKARQSMYRLRNEMKVDIEGSPLADLEKARREVSDFKNDIKQMGRDLANSHEEILKQEVIVPSASSDASGEKEALAKKKLPAKNNQDPTSETATKKAKKKPRKAKVNKKDDVKIASGES